MLIILEAVTIPCDINYFAYQLLNVTNVLNEISNTPSRPTVTVTVMLMGIIVHGKKLKLSRIKTNHINNFLYDSSTGDLYKEAKHNYNACLFDMGTAITDKTQILLNKMADSEVCIIDQYENMPVASPS